MFPGILKRIGRFFAMAVGVSLVGAAIGWNLLVAEPPFKPSDVVQLQQQFNRETLCQSVGRTTPLGGATGRLAYQSSNGKGNKTYVLCVNGTGQRSLPAEAGNNPIESDWSPDGRTLLTFGWSAFVITEIDAKGNWRDNKRVFFDPELAAAGGLSTPRWSPDGKRLTLTSKRDGDCHGDIWVVDVETDQSKRVFDHSQIPGLAACDGIADMPSWSPGGDLISFSGGHSLWLLDLASGRVARWLSLGNMLRPATRTHWTRYGLFYSAFSTEQNATRIFQIAPNMACLREGLRNAAQLPDCGTPQVITQSVRWALMGMVDEQKCPREEHGSPALSPDGAYLAFVSEFYKSDGSLCLSRIMITSVARPNEVFGLDSADGLNTYDPVWQPIVQ